MMIVVHVASLESERRRANIPRGGIRPLPSYTRMGYVASMRNDTRASCLKRLNRIAGQVRGITRMVEEDRYCIDIVTQLSAVRAALRRVEDEVLNDHVGHCVEHAIMSGNRSEQRRKVAELMTVLQRAER